MRKLRKKAAISPGKLRDSSGELVQREERAETIAKYLEETPWATRAVSVAPDRPPLGDVLAVDKHLFTAEEVHQAASQMRKGRSCGEDGVPVEFWQAIISPGSQAAKWLTELLRSVWCLRRIPDEWHASRVASLFKAGDPTECSN